MDIYIWKCVDYTHNYHSDAGVVIIASSYDKAKEMFLLKHINLRLGRGVSYDDTYDTFYYESLDEALSDTKFTYKSVNDIPSPDYVIALVDPSQDEQVIVFPNAGCC